MKRVTDLCKLACALEHPGTPGRRTVTTAQDVAIVGSEQHRNRDSQYADGYIRSNGMPSSSAKFAEADSMKRRWNEKHSVCGLNAEVSNLRDASSGEPRSTIFCHEAEAESPRVFTPFQKPAILPENSRSRPDEYNVQKARLHANLWQQEINKHIDASTCIEEDADCALRESSGWNRRKSMPEDWESFNPSEEGECYEGNLAREEVMMLEEYQKRRERNRIQIASFVKQHIYGRRRPVDGWKYILNNFGKDGKGARGSALSGEGQPAGSALEKLALKGEKGGTGRKN